MEIDINSFFYKKEGLELEYKEGFGKDDLATTIAAFSTSKGGYILMGVENKSGGPVGIKISSEDDMRNQIYNIAKNLSGGRASLEIGFKSQDKEKKIVIIRVHEGDRKPYGWKGAYYKRAEASDEKLGPDEITKIRLDSYHITFDSLSSKIYNRSANVSDLDEDKIKDYVNEVKSGKRNKVIEFTNALDTLKNLDLLNCDHEVKNAGFLFFGKSQKYTFPQSRINFLIYGGKTINSSTLKFRKVIGGSLLKQIKESLKLIRINTENRIVMDGFKRIEINQYPLNAIREAIINAIAHRDYSIYESDIVIRLFEDRLEIINPGGLMEGIILEELKKGGHPSVRRNPLICSLLDKLGYMEESGQGIKNMINAMKEFGLAEPSINPTKNFFKIDFYGQEIKSGENNNSLIGTSLNLKPFLSEKEAEGLSYIQSMPEQSITITKYMGALDVKTRITAKNHLDNFEKYGILKSEIVKKERVYFKKI